MDITTQPVIKPIIAVPPGRIHVKIYAPYRVYFDDLADNISAVNLTGPFDVLPQHHNFMTLLSPCVIVVRNDKEEKRIQISRGVMHVKKDNITVFLDV